jgi:hypothetical protein
VWGFGGFVAGAWSWAAWNQLSPSSEVVGIRLGVAGAVVGAVVGPIFVSRVRRKGREAQRDKILADLSGLRDEAQTGRRGLAELVSAAEAHLAVAEREFDERAFAPFWDDVERATNALATYQRRVQGLESNVKEYRTVAERLDDVPLESPEVPELDVSTRVVDPRPTASKLQDIVRRAQRDFEFASIFEQRKTNQILVDGFGSLQDAISCLGATLSDSLSNLADTLHASLHELLEEQEGHGELLIDIEQHQKLP